MVTVTYVIYLDFNSLQFKLYLVTASNNNLVLQHFIFVYSVVKDLDSGWENAHKCT